jgi:hypothetical protein
VCNILFHGVGTAVDILIVSLDRFHQVYILSLPHVDMHFFYKDSSSVAPWIIVKALSLSYFRLSVVLQFFAHTCMLTCGFAR